MRQECEKEQVCEVAPRDEVNLLVFIWSGGHQVDPQFFKQPPRLSGIIKLQYFGGYQPLLGQWLNFKLFGITYLVGKLAK